MHSSASRYLLPFLLLPLLLTGCNREPEAPSATTPVAENALPVQEEDTRPNILLIVADDLGVSDLGVYGSEIPTPNLDALARGGMMLTQFYAGMTCSPTRSMIMSGMDNHRAGLGSMGLGRDAQEGDPGYSAHLNFRVASLADLMTDAGYNTYMAGKWHLGNESDTGPHARGFKKAFASFDGAAHLGPWDWRGPQNANYWDDDQVVQVDDDFYSTRTYTERMISYIDADRDTGKPFFGWLAYTAPHWPLQAPSESIARMGGRYDMGYEALYEYRFNRQVELGLIPGNVEPIPDDRFSPRWADLSAEEKAVESRKMEIYAAMVSDLDTYIGEVIDYLKDIGEYDNTLLIFISDNGTEAGRMDLGAGIQEHVGREYDHSLDNLGSASSYVNYGRNWASATQTPLYRHKATGFEGGIRVPAFAHAPGLIQPGTRSDAIGHVMDLLPTFMDVAEADLPGGTYRGEDIYPVQGKSLLQLLRGESDAVHGEDEVIGWELHGHRSVRAGDWKIVWDQSQPPEERQWQLFNLSSDPFEQQDLSSSNPEKLQEMVANWEAYTRDSGVIYIY